jgi:hypothetical protein
LYEWWKWEDLGVVEAYLAEEIFQRSAEPGERTEL